MSEIREEVQYRVLLVKPFFFPVTLRIWELVRDLVSKSMVLYFNLMTSSISSISCFFLGFFFLPFSFSFYFSFSSSSSSGMMSSPLSSKEMGISFMLSSSIFSFNSFSCSLIYHTKITTFFSFFVASFSLSSLLSSSIYFLFRRLFSKS